MLLHNIQYKKFTLENRIALIKRNTGTHLCGVRKALLPEISRQYTLTLMQYLSYVTYGIR